MNAPDYIAQPVGRPLDRTDLSFEIDNFGYGTDTYYPSTYTKESPIHRVINGRCLYGTTLDRRKGIVLTGAEGAVGKVYMSTSMEVKEDEDIFFRLVNGAGVGVQLQAWDGAAWNDVGSNIGTSDDRVDWYWASARINGEDRLYFTNGVSELKYTEGNFIYTVTGVYAKFITSVGDVLVIGHPTSVFEPNQVLYAKAGTHQFYSDLDGSYANSSQYFTLNGEVTQVKSFNSNIYGFTKSNGLFEIDLIDLTARQISTHGTMSPKSVDVGWDVMIWADQYGIWALPLGGDVLKISKKVDNLYSLVSASNIIEIVGHINTDGQYELYIGTVTINGETVNKYCLVYEIDRSRQEGQNIWVEDIGRAFPNNCVNWTNRYGFTQSYMGSRDTQSTYQLNYGFDDDGITIDMKLYTKDIRLVDDKKEFVLNAVYIDYIPSELEAIDFEVYARTDVSDALDYSFFGGVVASADGSFLKTARIESRNNFQGHTLGLLITFAGVAADDLQIRRVRVTYNVNNNDLPIT